MADGKENGAPSGIVVFSGGTAANSLVDVFNKIIAKRGCPLQYIIPISDNGGSSSELIRVFGGPSKSHRMSSDAAFFSDQYLQVLVMFEVRLTSHRGADITAHRISICVL